MQDASHYAVPPVPPERGAEWILLRPGVWLAPVPLEQALAAKTAPKSEAVDVVGNHGRWVVQCPDCLGAQLACRTDPRFMCCECANAAIGGLWRPVAWPKGADRLGEILDQRPSLRDRNFEPGETSAQLLEQNALLASATDLGALTPDLVSAMGAHIGAVINGVEVTAAHGAEPPPKDPKGGKP